jgi:hypothetical protein
MYLAGDEAKQHEQQMDAEIKQLEQVVQATPADVKTRPGEGLGVPSPGFKHLGQMEVLVSTQAKRWYRASQCKTCSHV